jgi:hypothetical protein
MTPEWIAMGLAAKVLGDVCRRRYGFQTPGRLTSAGRGIETDLAYVLAYGTALLVVVNIGLHAALVVAVVLRLADIIGERVLLTSNHTVLELFLALVCLRLYETPVALAAVLQVMAVSVWLYAAFQKAYQGEYHDGSYFYLTLPYARSRLGKWTPYLQRVPAIDQYYSAIDRSAQTFCQRLAILVLVTESVLPIVAFATSGTIWSALLLLAVAVPVGLLTSETNFMITNVLQAASFLVPFGMAAFLRGVSDPVVAGVVVWFLIWPPVHAVLARRLRFSPWRPGGWGMYSRQVPRIDVVLPDGALRAMRESTVPARLVRDFGACRIGWLRRGIHRVFFRWGCTDAEGLVIRWYRRRQDRFVTHCVVFPRAPQAESTVFEICDEQSTDAFLHHVSSLPQVPADAPCEV